jgi:hypothetical protein
MTPDPSTARGTWLVWGRRLLTVAGNLGLRVRPEGTAALLVVIARAAMADPAPPA